MGAYNHLENSETDPGRNIQRIRVQRGSCENLRRHVSSQLAKRSISSPKVDRMASSAEKLRDLRICQKMGAHLVDPHRIPWFLS